MNIPCDTVESQASSEWLWVAFPHELTHYFLLQEFPDRKFDIRARAWHLEGMSSITISLPDMHNSRTDSGFYELQRERYET